MESLKKVGIAVVLLLLLIVIVPKIPQFTDRYILSVLGFSFTDFILLAVAVFVILLIILIFLIRSDITPKGRFRRLYKPKSDMQRLREYIKERIDAKESRPRIRHTLLKVGWDEKTINSAFKTYKRAKLIKLKQFKLKKKIRKSKK